MEKKKILWDKAAEILCIAEGTLKNWVHSGEFPKRLVHRHGRKFKNIHFFEEEIVEYE